MHFTKESKNWYQPQLKGTITNTFSFCLKSLNTQSYPTQTTPNSCQVCRMPLLSQTCLPCNVGKKLPTNLPKNIIYKQEIKEDLKEIMIVCIDLSGSMSLTYRSLYEKINQRFVKRLLGEKNYQYLRKKLGLNKVVKNYLLYQMLLNGGESARDIAEMNKTEFEYSETNEPENKKQQSFISRKQIIQIAIDKLIQILKIRKPETEITVVYFNNNIEIPIDDFNDKHQITGIQTKTVKEMFELGMDCSNFISRAKFGSIGEQLIMNLTKATQSGQTGLGPALAFCLGLGKAFKSAINQIVLVTDGMSNIGFGQTENEQQKNTTQHFYQQIGIKYAKPSNCVVDIVTFQDCCIGYDQLDRLIEVTGGIPCQIQFTQEKEENVVKEETISDLSFKLVTALCEYPNQLCFESKITIWCSDPKIRLQVCESMRPFIQLDKGNLIIIQAGIISSTRTVDVTFRYEEEVEEFDEIVRFMVIGEYKRTNMKLTAIVMDKVTIQKGTQAQAEKSEGNTLQKQIKQKLKPRQIFEQDLSQYSSISQKISENKSIEESIDKVLLEKFKQKKQKIQNVFKNIDKLSMQKLSMRSRAQKTFNRDESDFGDECL